MFIHRPNTTDKEIPRTVTQTEKIELIVAKHRNGPTHSGIELIFFNNLARFENAALNR
jgi:replicative DNA helicase